MVNFLKLMHKSSKILQISYNKMYKYTKILIKNHKNYVEEINFSKNYENEI